MSLPTDVEQRGRDAESTLAYLTRELRSANPGKSISLTMSCSLHHSSAAVDWYWTVQVGHDPVAHGKSFGECLQKRDHARSPEGKRARAAELRREAAQLEEAANFQTKNHDA